MEQEAEEFREPTPLMQSEIIHFDQQSAKKYQLDYQFVCQLVDKHMRLSQLG
jgi:hypothetical protein